MQTLLPTRTHEHKMSLFFEKYPGIFTSGSRALQSVFKNILTSEFHGEMSSNTALLWLVEGSVCGLLCMPSTWLQQLLSSTLSELFCQKKGTRRYWHQNHLLDDSRWEELSTRCTLPLEKWNMLKRLQRLILPTLSMMFPLDLRKKKTPSTDVAFWKPSFLT